MDKNRKARIVAIVGMCGSGKSVAADFFEKRGWSRVYFGGVTMRELEKRGLEKNEKNERAVREELRREYGMGAFAKLLLPDIASAAEKGDVVLDGLYSWSEYKELKPVFGERLTLLAVTVPRAIRYSRLSGRDTRPLTREEAEARDKAEIENMEKGGPIAAADLFADNSGTIEDLYRQLETLFFKK